MAQRQMSLPTINFAGSNWTDEIVTVLDYMRGWIEDGPLPIYFTNLDSAGAQPTASLFEDCIYLVKSNGDTTLAISDGTDLINLERAHYKFEQNTAGSGSPNIISAEESGKLFINRTATALNYHTLPSPHATKILHYRFGVLDADGIRVDAPSGQTIRIGTTETASSGFVKSVTIGSYLHTFSIPGAGYWSIATGTWTFDA